MDAEQTQVNLLVVRALEGLKIPYFLCGSMASSIHGIYRATTDADFVADVRPYHVEPLLGMLKVQGDALDRAYLRDWAARLGLTDLLLQALQDAGLAEISSAT